MRTLRAKTVHVLLFTMCLVFGANLTLLLVQSAKRVLQPFRRAR